MGIGVLAHTAPMAVALGPAAVLGSPGHIDDIGYQRPSQIILEAPAGLLGAEDREAGQRPQLRWKLSPHCVTAPSFNSTCMHARAHTHTHTHARLSPHCSRSFYEEGAGRDWNPAGQVGQGGTQQLVKTATPSSWVTGRGGDGGGSCLLCWDIKLPWETEEGSTLRFAFKSANTLPLPADSAPVGWVGLTYVAGGEPCVTPEDDAGCTQGSTLTNGGYEIHL